MTVDQTRFIARREQLVPRTARFAAIPVAGTLILNLPGNRTVPKS